MAIRLQPLLKREQTFSYIARSLSVVTQLICWPVEPLMLEPMIRGLILLAVHRSMDSDRNFFEKPMISSTLSAWRRPISS